MQQINYAMAKRKIIRRQNKPYTFAIGGALANAGATAVSGLINPSGNSTGVGNAMQTIGSVASNIPGVGGLIGAGVNMLGGVVNAAFGSKINEEFVDDTEASAKQQSGYVSGASTNDQLLSDWSNFNNLANVTKSQVGSDGWFSSKAKRETRRLNKEIDNANLRAQKSLVNTAGNIDTSNDSALLANYAADGGLLLTGDAIDYNFINEQLYNKRLEAMSKNKLTSMPNSFEVPQYGIDYFADGGNLSRDKDYGSKKKPYPMVPSSDFAGPHRSYPIPTKANARDALRLAGLHGNSSVRAKVLAKYPSLRKEDGGMLFAEGGGIHIKKKNKGKFTDYCGGKVTAECIARGKRSNNPTIVKRATFADNARGWAKANGGYMDYNYDETFAPTGTLFQGAWDSLTTHPDALTHGGVFSDEVTVVGEGGSHEENPLSGVPMGLAPDGQPNLVEEGEVVFNDYVFSNRLHPTEKMLKQYNIPLKYKDHTFASIAEKFNKEPKERPNDPIAKRGLLANMGKLMQAQEEVRAKKEARQGTQFALGGFTNANDDTLLYGDPFTYNDFLGSQGSISNPNDNSPSSDEDGFGASWLRYAPVVGSGISALASLRDKPNYAGANAVGNAVANMSPITATPIGNKLRYTPLDREFYLNKLDASAGATRRAVNNNAGGNRGTAMAGILAADYNYGQNLGNFARQAEEYNQAQKERVEGFNRQTDMFDSEAGLKAATATQGVREAQLRGIIEEYNMRNAERNRVSANRSANLTGFFDNLGEVGREEFIRNQIQSNPAYNYNLTRSGKVKYKGNKKGGKNG